MFLFGHQQDQRICRLKKKLFVWSNTKLHSVFVKTLTLLNPFESRYAHDFVPS